MKNQELIMDVVLHIHKNCFERSFLETTVAKKLAIKGDNLLYELKPEHREDTKRFSQIFSKDMMYDCMGIRKNKVKLVGINLSND